MKLVAIVAGVGFVLTFGVSFILASVQRADAAGMCLADAGALPAEVNGYKSDQLTNAAAIVRAGMDLGVDQRGQVLAVMTAMGESSTARAMSATRAPTWPPAHAGAPSGPPEAAP